MQSWMNPNQERTVCAMLDKSGPGVAGWDDMAYYLGFSGNERLIMGTAEAALSSWRHRSPQAVTYDAFIGLMKKIKRNDIVQYLEGGGGGGHAHTPSPFDNVIAQQITPTVSTLFNSPEYDHYRTAILLEMDKTRGWVTFLGNRKLLGTTAMEQWKAGMLTQWERNRSGNPTMTTFTQIMQRDAAFAKTSIFEFAQELINLNIPSVTAEVVTLTSWITSQSEQSSKASEVAFTAQANLRSWLLKNGICEATKVDELIPRLRNAGVNTIDNIRGFDKGELKECGFNTVQAIAILKALK